MTGRLVAVVGASGVGKDSVMTALAETTPQISLARRVITRPSDAGGEDFDGIGEAEFLARDAAGEFALSWSAHGLRYAIPDAVDVPLLAGHDVLANLSRSVLTQATARFEQCEVLHLTASREVLEQRLIARGRESRADIMRRLDRTAGALPAGIKTHQIDNSGPLDLTVQAVIAALYPVRA
jgi:ribose 1,5-bisphosphokinase